LELHRHTYNVHGHVTVLYKSYCYYCLGPSLFHSLQLTSPAANIMHLSGNGLSPMLGIYLSTEVCSMYSMVMFIIKCRSIYINPSKMVHIHNQI